MAPSPRAAVGGRRTIEPVSRLQFLAGTDGEDGPLDAAAAAARGRGEAGEEPAVDARGR